MSTLYLPTSIARNAELSSAVQSKTPSPPHARLDRPQLDRKEVVERGLLDCQSLSLFKKYRQCLLMPIQGRRTGLLQNLFIRTRSARGASASCSPDSQSARSVQPPAIPVLLLDILQHTGICKTIHSTIACQWWQCDVLLVLPGNAWGNMQQKPSLQLLQWKPVSPDYVKQSHASTPAPAGAPSSIDQTHPGFTALRFKKRFAEPIQVPHFQAGFTIY